MPAGNGEDMMARLSLADRIHQAAFAALYPWAARMARLTGRKSNAAAVALWHRGRVLVVRHSYTRGLSLPGGHVGTKEPPAFAAVRELAEEVGIVVAPSAIRLFGQMDLRHTRLTLFESELSRVPKVRIDNREVTDAVFMAPDAIVDPSLILRRYLRARSSES